MSVDPGRVIRTCADLIYSDMQRHSLAWRRASPVAALRSLVRGKEAGAERGEDNLPTSRCSCWKQMADALSGGMRSCRGQLVSFYQGTKYVCTTHGYVTLIRVAKCVEGSTKVPSLLYFILWPFVQYLPHMPHQPRPHLASKVPKELNTMAAFRGRRVLVH